MTALPLRGVCPRRCAYHKSLLLRCFLVRLCPFGAWPMISFRCRVRVRVARTNTVILTKRCRPDKILNRQAYLPPLGGTRHIRKKRSRYAVTLGPLRNPIVLESEVVCQRSDCRP